MIYPQQNAFRQVLDLSGSWDFKLDPRGEGKKKKWHRGLKETRKIPVPSSWNNHFAGTQNYLGDAWYQMRFSLPHKFQGPRRFIRFGSVNYLAEAWLNGHLLGSHEGGHLPFVFEITKHLKKGKNLLAVRVNGALAPDRVPPGRIPFDPRDAFANTFNPPASFDFFPYCGIQRPVLLFSLPQESIQDVTVTTDLAGTTGKVRVAVESPKTGVSCRVTLQGFGWTVLSGGPFKSGRFETVVSIPNAKLWAPGSPNLYQLKVELIDAQEIFDRVNLSVGIRTVKVMGGKLLLNGKPIFLKGFGRHEDDPKTGRFLPASALKKDYENMKWIGANSFRTSHYPYSDEDMALADRLGYLVIDETPAVGLYFHPKGLKKRLQLCRQFTKELIQRDKNHPSVILWSIANEPHSKRPGAIPFFKNLAQLARQLDPSRPLTLASYLGASEESFKFLDVVCVNRYMGWYSEPGDLDLAIPRLSKDLDAIYRKFKKPVVMTEFGADAIPGSHMSPPAMFSEEYQAEMIARYWEVLRKKPYVSGAHIWNLNDFKTAQATHRPNGMNYKGVFTQGRKPKLAAHLIRKLWNTQKDISNTKTLRN
jgi:beta-glucuronidase